MSKSVNPAITQIPDCPYVGLQPYTEAQRAYFFGREQDSETIAANLVSSPLTLFYGASGVGKSSVLAAGVVPYLRMLPTVLVVNFRTWQDQTFQVALRQAIVNEIAAVTGQAFSPDAAWPLD